MNEKELKDVMEKKGYSVYIDIGTFISFYKNYRGCVVKMNFRKNYDNSDYNLHRFYVEGQNFYGKLKLEALTFAYYALERDVNELIYLLNKGE